MNSNELSSEQRERARSVQTLEELEELAKEEGQEISDDQLDAICGGGDSCFFSSGCIQKTDLRGYWCPSYHFF